MSGRRKMVIGWTVLLVGTAVVWLAAFAVMEGWGLTHDDAITLSRYVWEINRAWPLFLPLVAYIGGGMQWGFLVHILWRWNPEDQKDHRG